MTQIEEFIEAVKQMRRLQKHFYQNTRNFDILEQAKKQEKRVDVLLAELNNPQERLL